MQKKLIYIILIVSVLVVVIAGGVIYYKLSQKELKEELQLKDLVVRFVRRAAEDYFDKNPTQYPEELEVKGDWDIEVTIYHTGETKGKGEGKDKMLTLALEKASKNVFEDEKTKNLKKKDLKNVRFLVTFKSSSADTVSPDGSASETFTKSFIEYKGRGKEVIGDLVIIHSLDKDLIQEKIEQGKEFLFRIAQDKNEHGFYKKYDVLNDSFEDRLHTVYSASIMYTFLYIYDYDKDEKILENISDWGGFLLSMQNKDKEDKRYGAFHYSYYFDKKEKEKRFVVGTSALSIFTLLRLYVLTDDPKYLESAKLAGDWLIKMQRSDGTIKPYVR